MKKNSNNLVLNSLKILMLCREPIFITHLRSKTSHDGVVFKHYIEYLSVLSSLTIEEKEGNRTIHITDKGRKTIKTWIELNEMLGVKVDAYLCKQ